MWPEHDHSNYNCVVTNDQGDTKRVYGNWIHNQGHDHFLGWHCDAGVTRFYIDKNLDLWGGQCRNVFLGNVLDQWVPQQVATVCNQPRCGGCTDDLITKKHSCD